MVGCCCTSAGMSDHAYPPGVLDPLPGVLSLLNPLFTQGTIPKKDISETSKKEMMNLSLPTGHDLKF